MLKLPHPTPKDLQFLRSIPFIKTSVKQSGKKSAKDRYLARYDSMPSLLGQIRKAIQSMGWFRKKVSMLLPCPNAHGEKLGIL